MAIRKLNAITGRAAQKHKKPAAAGSCQPAGSTAPAATQGERNGVHQRNTFAADYAFIGLPFVGAAARLPISLFCCVRGAAVRQLCLSSGGFRGYTGRGCHFRDRGSLLR